MHTACIVNLDRIPLFYISRLLQAISVDKKSALSRITIFSLSDTKRFW
jgi:hypothetical protein